MTAIESATPKFKELLTKADTLLKMKVLTLAFVLELDGAGWTRPISERQLFNAMGLSRSKSQAVNLKVYLAELEAAGALASCCEKGSKKKYRFGYLAEIVASGGGDSRHNAVSQVAENIASGGGNSTPINPNGDGLNPPKATPLINYESIYESFTHKDKAIHEGVDNALRMIGADENALHLAEKITLGQVLDFIKAGQMNPKVTDEKLPAYVVGCIKRENEKSVQQASDETFNRIRREYESSIGACIPMVHDAIKDALKLYPVNWILEAIAEAKKAGAVHWNYVLKILVRWAKEGKKELPTKKVDDAPVYHRVTTQDFVDPEARRQMDELRRRSWEGLHAK